MITTALISCLLFLGQLQIESAQSTGNNQLSNEVQSRHADYVQLNRQIYARHEDPESEKVHISQPDRIAEIRSRLHKLLSDEIDNMLNGPTS